MSDIVQWDQSNKNHVVTHGVLGSTGDFTSIGCRSTYSL